MKVNVIHTEKISPQSNTLLELLDKYIPALEEASIIAITSKIVSLCEGNVLKLDENNKEELVVSESQYYLPPTISQYGYHFTITNDTLISVAGIDESNGDGYYVLWPKNAQATANAVRRHLAERFTLTKVGVVITDSTCQPLRRGTSGIDLAHSGFKALRDYEGIDDLFGRPYNVTQANISGGLAATAVFAMGEGNEQTPICIMTDLASIDFQNVDPTPAELRTHHIDMDEDLFAPLLQSVKWKKGKKWKKA